MTNLVAYLLVRTDLPSMGRGKAHAHGMHAGNHLTWKYVVEPLQNGLTPDPHVMEWHKQGGGFGTTIALGKDKEMPLAVIDELVGKAWDRDVIADFVVDPTYPYFVDDEIYPLIDESVHTSQAIKTVGGWMCFRKETTMGYIMGDKEKVRDFMSSFNLVPND